MRRIPSIYALLVVLVLAIVTGCGAKRPNPDTQTQPSVPAAAPAQPAEKPAAKPEIDRTGWPVIVAFGDSLTAGYNLPADQSYPSQLQAKLDELGYKYKVVNAGISGDTTAGGVARIETVLMHKPRIVILELGANDGLRGTKVAVMRENLSKMIERLQKEGAVVILAGMQMTPNLGPEYLAEFNGAFPDLAKAYNLPLIPFFLEGVAAIPELNLPDRIHPTGEGYKKVVENLFPVLEPHLKK